MKVNLGKVATLFVLISLFIFCSGLVISEAATLSIGSDRAKPNENVTVPIVLISKPESNISSINLDLIYDANKLTFNKAQAGKILSEAAKSLSTSQPAQGRLRIVIMGLNQNVLVDGALANVTFLINANAKAGSVLLKISNVAASSPQAKSVNLKLKPGRIIIQKNR